MHEILEMCKQISAEKDPAKLVPILGKLSKLLAAEQQRLTAVLAKNEAELKTNPPLREPSMKTKPSSRTLTIHLNHADFAKD